MNDTCVIRKRVNATDESGCAYATGIYPSTPFANAAKNTESLSLPKKYTTSFPSPKEVQMMKATSWRSALHVTPRSLPGKESAGDGRGGRNLCDLSSVQRAWGRARKKSGSNGGFTYVTARR